MSSMQGLSSTSPVIDDASKQEYLDIVDEVVTTMEEEEVSERKLILTILEEYKKKNLVNVEYYLACNRFTGTIKPVLQKMYMKLYDHWNQKNGRMDVMDMPCMIRKGKVDAEHMKNYALEKLYLYSKDKPRLIIDYKMVCPITKLSQKNVRKVIFSRLLKEEYHQRRNKGASFVLSYEDGRVRFTPNEDGLDSQEVELCRGLVDDDNFKNYMKPTDDYLTDIDESTVDDSIKDRIVLLKFLVAVRQGEGKKMEELVDTNKFPPSNEEAMRRLYHKGYKDYVVKYGIRTSFNDPVPYPRSIAKKKFATKEEQDILENELRKKLDRHDYVVNGWVIGELTNRSEKTVLKWMGDKFAESWNLTREEQDKLREERWKAIEKSVALHEAKKRAFEKRQLVSRKVRRECPSGNRRQGRKANKVVLNVAPPSMRGNWAKVVKKVTFNLPEKTPIENDISNTGDVLDDDEEFLAAFEELNLLMEQAADIIHPHKKVSQDQNNHNAEVEEGKNENEVLPPKRRQKRSHNKDNSRLSKRPRIARQN